MILYLDTSALVRLYIDEGDHRAVREAAQRAQIVVTHLITCVEMWASLARMGREGRLDPADLELVRGAFERDWSAFLVILPVEPMIRHAGDLADRHGLPGYDSVQLAAAESVHAQCGEEIELLFAACDLRLVEAARAPGMRAVP